MPHPPIESWSVQPLSGTLGILVLGFVVAALPQIGVAPNIVGLAFGLVLGSLAAR